MAQSTSNIVNPYLKASTQGLVSGGLVGSLQNPPTYSSVSGSDRALFASTSMPGTSGATTTSGLSGLVSPSFAPNASTGPGQSTYVPPPTSYNFTPQTPGGGQGTTGATTPINSGSSKSNLANIDYTLHPGESIDAYNARIAAARAARDAAQGTQGGSAGGTSSITPTPAPQTPSAPQYTPQPNPGGYNTNPYTAPAPTYPGLVGSLAGTAAGPTQQYIDAQNQYLEANKGLAQLRADAAQQRANIGGSRTNLAEAGGEQGLLQNLVAGKEAALTGEMSAAQAAAQVATGQQGVQQSGLYGAAGLAAPIGGNALGFYNPTTGQWTPYGGQGGGVGNAGQVLGQLGSSQNFYQNLVPSFNQAQSVYQGLTGFIQQNPDINPTSANFVNSINAWARGQQLSDPKYQQFTQYLNELLQTLTPIIGSQGVSDYKSQLVQTMVNPSSSSQSIMAQIQNLMSIAQGKMDATQQSFQSGTPYQGGNMAPLNQGATQGGVTLGNTQFYQKPDGTWAYR